MLRHPIGPSGDTERTSRNLSAPPINGRSRLAWLSLVGGTAATLGGIYVGTGWGVPCPFLAATGWWCPICGSSRMGEALLGGDLAAAWGWNPFVMFLGAVMGGVWVWTLVRLVQRRPVNLPGLFGVIDRLSPSVLLFVILVPAIFFMVVRNLW